MRRTLHTVFIQRVFLNVFIIIIILCVCVQYFTSFSEVFQLAFQIYDHYVEQSIFRVFFTNIAMIVLFWCMLIIVHAAKDQQEPVSCGSAIKLQHKDFGYYLHSHGIAWGSGSGQQSVTTNKVKADKNSLWLVKEKMGDEICQLGQPVKCGDIIRLEHVDTKKNLHSHLFKAPLSGNQEVSGFGTDGTGDTGDNWKVVCETSDSLWMRNKPIALMHVDTSKYLVSALTYQFTQQNCGGQCPIMSQTEVSLSAKKDVKARWQADQGLYFPQAQNDKDEEDIDDDEL